MTPSFGGMFGSCTLKSLHLNNKLNIYHKILGNIIVVYYISLEL